MLSSEAAYRSVFWNLERMFQELHALRLKVPEEGSMVDPSLLCNGLGIAAELLMPKGIVCTTHKDRLLSH